MDSDDKRMLEKVMQMTEQNNRILRKMRREVLWGRFFHFIYWVLIIGIAVVSYYYIKPYLGSLDNALQTIDKVKNVKLPS